MTVRTELADGTTEVFETSNYKISVIKNMHPLIVAVFVFSHGKLIKKVHRPFPFFYRHFTFKSYKVQSMLKELDKQNQEQ